MIVKLKRQKSAFTECLNIKKISNSKKEFMKWTDMNNEDLNKFRNSYDFQTINPLFVFQSVFPIGLSF